MSKEQQQEVEVVACDDVLHDLVRFTDSSYFRDEINDFISNHIDAFVDALYTPKLNFTNVNIHDGDRKVGDSKYEKESSKDDSYQGSRDSDDVEHLIRQLNDLPHSYNALFEQYQRRIDDLFDVFSKKHRVSNNSIYACFRDAGIMFKSSCQHVTDEVIIFSIYYNFSGRQVHSHIRGA